MEQLGRNHPGLISPLLPELLSLDPHFDMPEPNMADDCYVAVMIAVYNAASVESSLISLFPCHAERHYRFHRRRFTEFIPPVPLVSLCLCTSCTLGESMSVCQSVNITLQEETFRRNLNFVVSLKVTSKIKIC